MLLVLFDDCVGSGLLGRGALSLSVSVCEICLLSCLSLLSGKMFLPCPSFGFDFRFCSSFIGIFYWLFLLFVQEREQEMNGIRKSVFANLCRGFGSGRFLFCYVLFFFFMSLHCGEEKQP